MGRLTIKRRKSQSPQVGDMRERILLQERDIATPKFGSQKFSQDYTPIDEVWAGVTTITGTPLFTGVNPDKAIDVIFDIRYRDDVTSETIVTWDGDNYEIIDPVDPDKRKRFLQLMCSTLGDSTKEANR